MMLGVKQSHRRFHVGWDQLASSAGPPFRKHREIRVGRRGEAPLVAPYRFRSPNKAMDLGVTQSRRVVEPAVMSATVTELRRGRARFFLTVSTPHGLLEAP